MDPQNKFYRRHMTMNKTQGGGLECGIGAARAGGVASVFTPPRPSEPSFSRLTPPLQSPYHPSSITMSSACSTAT